MRDHITRDCPALGLLEAAIAGVPHNMDEGLMDFARKRILPSMLAAGMACGGIGCTQQDAQNAIATHTRTGQAMSSQYVKFDKAGRAIVQTNAGPMQLEPGYSMEVTGTNGKVRTVSMDAKGVVSVDGTQVGRARVR